MYKEPRLLLPLFLVPILLGLGACESQGQLHVRIIGVATEMPAGYEEFADMQFAANIGIDQLQIRTGTTTWSDLELGEKRVTVDENSVSTLLKLDLEEQDIEGLQLHLSPEVQLNISTLGTIDAEGFAALFYKKYGFPIPAQEAYGLPEATNYFEFTGETGTFPGQLKITRAEKTVVNIFFEPLYIPDYGNGFGLVSWVNSFSKDEFSD